MIWITGMMIGSFKKYDIINRNDISVIDINVFINHIWIILIGTNVVRNIIRNKLY